MKRLVQLLILVACATPALGQERAFLGQWDITGTGKHADYVYWLEVKKEGDALEGYFLNRGGSVLKLPSISIEGGELVFDLGRPGGPRQTHRVKAAGGKLMGTLTTDKETIQWVGVRSPRWRTFDANAKHRFGTPVELFDGKSLDTWDVQRKDKPSGWSVSEGTMTNQAGANNLVSKQKFDNFKIHCEYKLEEKSNSGIYLRGRYELQVLDDFGKEAESHGHMAIYSRIAPSVNASKAPGEWQVMEAVIVGNRVTVTLNGKTVHDNAVLAGITGGALDSNEAAPGPIMLQGDHGRVWFRKVTVTPILK
jgi:3-keto-disaccharide hydrolase